MATNHNQETNTNIEIKQTAQTSHVEVVHEPTIYAEPIFHVGSLQITNALLTSWLAVFVIILISLLLRFRLKKIPGKFQHFFEIIIDGGLSLVDQVTNDRKISNKIFPFVFSVFIFIIVNNWLGIMPFIGSIGFYMMHDGHNVFVPMFRGGTADINMTLTLGILSVVGSNIFGIFILGVWKTINKYVKIQELGSIFTKIKKDPSIVVVAPISFFVGIVELIGEMAKIASLSFRLFGNIFAGEVLLSSMAAIFAFGIPMPFLFLEVFVGLIQALIFSLLTTVYFTIAAQDHDDHRHEEHPKHRTNKEERLVQV